MYFFLQRFYNEDLAKNLMFQLSVLDINEAFQIISSLDGFDIKYEPIKTEHWGKVVFLKGLKTAGCSLRSILAHYF
jgi:hypothetical protein